MSGRSTPVNASVNASVNAGDVPRSRKGVHTRARLVDAAREVFEQDGFLTARISDIAAGAGLSQ